MNWNFWQPNSDLVVEQELANRMAIVYEWSTLSRYLLIYIV